MSHSTFTLKLSPRLLQINAMVKEEYDHIWDCCCDHGLLGFSLLSSGEPESAASTIGRSVHFVDIVPELISSVKNKLQRFYANNNVNNTWFTHCLDVAKLPLHQYPGRHLIIIAGVGGDLMINFIKALHLQYPEAAIDFLLCPVHHQYSLRSTLIELDFSLLDEVLIEDKQRFYEVLLVSTKSDEANKISVVGDKIWQANSEEQQLIITSYLQKTLKHYQRLQRGEANKVQHIINAYSTLI